MAVVRVFDRFSVSSDVLRITRFNDILMVVSLLDVIGGEHSMRGSEAVPLLVEQFVPSWAPDLTLLRRFQVFTVTWI